jgi:hypothetical protein
MASCGTRFSTRYLAHRSARSAAEHQVVLGDVESPSYCIMPAKSDVGTPPTVELVEALASSKAREISIARVAGGS